MSSADIDAKVQEVVRLLLQETECTMLEALAVIELLEGAVRSIREAQVRTVDLDAATTGLPAYTLVHRVMPYGAKALYGSAHAALEALLLEEGEALVHNRMPRLGKDSGVQADEHSLYVLYLGIC